MPSKKHGCACEKCKECCKRESGWFLPDEVEIAAKYLKLPREKFVKQYCKEHFENDVFALSPKTKSHSTECIFLDAKGLCKIHPIKPYECRKVYGCEPVGRHRRIREIIKNQWR